MTTTSDSQSLVCWIGDTDLLALGKFGKDNDVRGFKETAKLILTLDKEGTAHVIENDIANLDRRTRDSSIILTIKESLRNRSIPSFYNVILLTNRPSNNPKLLEQLQDLYPNFIKRECKGFEGTVSVEFVPSANNTKTGVDGWDYAAVHAATKKILDKKITSGINRNTLWYNVTPGTIAQSTTLILIGKELSTNSNFIQVEKSKRRVIHCQIPFDINRAIDNQAAYINSTSKSDCPPIGKSSSFLKALDKAKRIAQSPVTVLLTGESGTGKEVLAREIHRMSGRTGKFIPINCAMLSKETGVTELTGFYKGAYTDAKVNTPGKFHEADGGTLFLDEIGDCPLDVQAELLRFLQPIDNTKQAARVWRLKGAEPPNLNGDERKFRGDQHADIRVIAATNKNLLDQSTFRKDLYYRIETIQIKMPNLDERKSERTNGTDDLKDLADQFLSNSNKNFSLNKKFHKDAYEKLRAHKWSGNVRELQNVITRVALLSPEETITAKDIADNLNDRDDVHCSSLLDDLKRVAEALAHHDISEGGISLDERIKEFCRDYCRAALQATGGNKKAAYTRLSTSPKTFEKAIRTP